jgi:hypothetical protein
MGIKAGLNMFIYRNSTQETLNIIEEVYNLAFNNKELENNIENSYEKIIKIKKNFY